MIEGKYFEQEFLRSEFDFESNKKFLESSKFLNLIKFFELKALEFKKVF